MAIEYTDFEWDEAERADEPKEYYWQKMYSGGWCVKLYKPSVARLFASRTGLPTLPLEKSRKHGQPSNKDFWERMKRDESGR